MRREHASTRAAAIGPLAVLVLTALLATSCSKLERFTFVRQNADRGKFTQVAPVYDVSGKARKPVPMPPQELLAAASTLYAAGQLEESRQKAQQVLKANPASGDAHTLLGLIASATGNTAEAGGHYQQALQAAPDNGAYANNYGIWLCGQGRAQESLAWFDKALADARYPTPATALSNAATCALQAGQPARAEANWRQALALDSTLLPALSGLSGLQFARGQYLDARAFVERWLALAPQDADALRLAAQIEQKQGDNAAARRYLQRLETLSPGAYPVPPTP